MASREALQVGVAAHRSGQLDRAESLYLDVLREDASDPDAWNLLGTIERQRKEFSKALEHTRRAVAISPASPVYQFSLGECLRGMEQFDEAIDAYRKCLEGGPVQAEIYHALGQACAKRGRHAEAADAYAEAVKLRPRFHQAHVDLAAYRAKAGQLAEAEALCREALLIPTLRGPDDPLAAPIHAQLGHLARAQGKHEQALESYERAANQRPDWADVRACIAECLNITHTYTRASEIASQAVRIDPLCFKGHIERGTALERLGRAVDAMDAFGTAVQIRPDSATAWTLFARTQLQCLGHETAIESYRRAIEAAPASAAFHEGILVAMNYAASVPDRAVFAEHASWAAHALGLGVVAPPRRVAARDPDRPLRVGYVSPDFHEHSISFFVEPILAGHNRGSIESVIFSDSLKKDATTDRLRRQAVEWLDTETLDDRRFVEAVVAQRIDILVDLAGHSMRNRLTAFMHRPAPVQLTYLGYASTTGLPREWMQYRFTDAICDPPGESDALHSESLLRLPAPFLCYRAPVDAPAVSSLPAEEAGYITFGCFNNMMKINRRTIEHWAKILLRVPKSRLLLKNKCASDAAVGEIIAEALECHGVERNRLIFRPPELTIPLHLSRYQEVDIALDTFPYNGTTTTCEAMWMGVPVVTLAGTSHRSRVGATLLSAVGAGDLIADTAEQYIEIAGRLALDIGKLADLRRGLRGRMLGSPLMDEKRFVCNLECAYRAIWREACTQGV